MSKSRHEKTVEMDRIWRPIKDQNAGYMFSLSDALANVETEHPGLLTSVSSGAMIVASDYSGQHKEATHEAYSFLVTTNVALRPWLTKLDEFRREWLPDNRRISFKKLNEPMRWHALPSFLELVSTLEGNLISIMVDRRIGSFVPGGPAEAIQIFPDCFGFSPNPGTVEKILRLASFVALINAGLRGERQPSHWISDHDETLDTHAKREGFARLAHYLTFGLTNWTNPADHVFGTTMSPHAPWWSEDLAAIPDLAAGAYCATSSFHPAFFGTTFGHAFRSYRDVTNTRAREIGNWLATRSGKLRSVLLRLEMDAHDKVRASAQTFIAQLYRRDTF